MNTLLDQFETVLKAETIRFTKVDFNEFFDCCNQYLTNALDKCIAKCTPLKMILRMIGSSCMRNESFDRSGKAANYFAHYIMIDVQKNINTMICQLVDENERQLVKDGMITLLCIQLFYDKRDYPDETEIIFLQKMSDRNECQDIAEKLLYRLHQLSSPINGNSSWAEIFTIVDPAKIDIKYLDLANSLETFTRCISNISKVLSECEYFQMKIKGYFEERISKDHIHSKLII